VTLATWLGFLVAAVVIAVSPGPGAVASMSSGARHGYWPTLTLIAGLQCALLLQLLVVAVGLGAVLAASETAFGVLKLLGAAYLVWLGVQKWRALPVAPDAGQALPARRGLFLQGLLVNLTNPKALVFIVALVPPFIDASAPQLPQYLLIAATLCATDIVVMSVYALAAARLGRWLHDPRALRAQNRFFGGLFAFAGAALAFSSRPH
jgi:homoserine/homoserine lactone efflux protein